MFKPSKILFSKMLVKSMKTTIPVKIKINNNMKINDNIKINDNDFLPYEENITSDIYEKSEKWVQDQIESAKYSSY